MHIVKTNTVKQEKTSEKTLNKKKTQKRKFILIDFLPENFVKDSDFDIKEEVILELDF